MLNFFRITFAHISHILTNCPARILVRGRVGVFRFTFVMGRQILIDYLNYLAQGNLCIKTWSKTKFLTSKLNFKNTVSVQRASYLISKGCFEKCKKITCFPFHTNSRYKKIILILLHSFFL